MVRRRPQGALLSIEWVEVVPQQATRAAPALAALQDLEVPAATTTFEIITAAAAAMSGSVSGRPDVVVAHAPIEPRHGVADAVHAAVHATLGLLKVWLRVPDATLVLVTT